MSESYKVTVDVIIFAVAAGELRTLLVKRRYQPFKGLWALPGGFVAPHETLDAAARRELAEETNVTDLYLEQLYTFGDPGRDPRGRIITVAYFAVVPAEANALGGSDAEEARWFEVNKLPTLAFDHRQIVEYAVERLRNKLEYTTVGFGLIAPKFTLSELQVVFEAVLDKELDKRNFRRKVLSLKVLEPLKEWKHEGIARPARYYRFSKRKFEKLKDKGILFPF